MNSDSVDTKPIKAWFEQLQSRLCNELAALDGSAEFDTDVWDRGITRTLANGAVFEKGGVGFSFVQGDKLPPTASAAHPELAGRSWQAMGVSLVMHPHNPYAPTSHMNVRFFIASTPGEKDAWWFGGGYDLTPYYGFEEDCRHWHQTAHDALEAIDPELYPKFKKQCDEYFHIKHRQEPRGIGGLFFDDFTDGGIENAFAVVKAVGNSYLDAYLPIVERRKDHKWGEQERNWQCYRRGRYVEFNLVQDRGTLFGLQSQGRTESILMSLPPEVHWHYNHQAEPGSPELELTQRFLQPQDWIH